MSASAQTKTISTHVPARLDRLPWSRFHWRVVVGLGGVWVLDGLEVTMVGNVSARLMEHNSGIALNAAQIGMAAAIYIAGACSGALFFGHLTDRFGRRNLFILTLAIYLVATVATAFAFAPWYFFLTRFFTGSGIGGEYAAINSAIDELIPARVRGRVDLVINGTYWLGSAAGAGGALILLNTANFPPNIGWRLAFGIGAILGIFVLLVRRNVPESPRWLFIHGREDEAEQIVGEIEAAVQHETGQPLPEPQGKALRIRQRTAISFREIAAVAFKLYPRRAVLGLALFIGQAFLYNGVTFNLGTLLSRFYNVPSEMVPVFFVLWALSNFAGPLVLGHLFDTVGRKPMITLTYIGSAVAVVALAFVFLTQAGGVWAFIGRPDRRVLPGVGGRQRGVPDGQRDLPDGDQGAGHRVLLRDGHGDRRYHRPVAVRSADQLGHAHRGRLVIPHRGGRDGRGRPGRTVARHRRRAAPARGAGVAVDRGRR